jgi:hypothetical protein
MSGNSYSGKCYRCGEEMHMYEDHKPHPYVSGDCHYCGFSYMTERDQLSLDEVNEMRIDLGMEPLDKLKEVRL